MDKMVMALLIVLMGVFDRWRGRAWPQSWEKYPLKTIADLALGWCVALLLGHAFDQAALLITLGMFTGSRFGWGEPLGAYFDRRPQMNPANYETWQFGIFRQNALYALWLRGAIWGICVLPAAWFDWRAALVVLCVTVAFPAAAWVGRQTRSWELLELSRGWILGVLVALVGLI
ncbi:MAG: hypothetical protein ACYCY1_12485 [Sulfuriferula sp.]